MEPLRVIAGARETLGDVARRLRAHQASAAPIVSSGTPVGLITRAQAENALRHGLAETRVMEVASGGAPRVSASADLRSMKRASIGIAPGLVVGGPRGTLRGIVTRHRLEEAIRRHVASSEPPPWLSGRDLGSRLNALLGPDRSNVLRRAGGLAGAQAVGLYLAGGVVRDLLLGKASVDLDLVVEGDGMTFAEELARILGAEVTRHEAFGTAAIEMEGGGKVDVASARRETYDTPSMLPRVAPGSMLEDLLRRDVTINSMAIRLDGSRYGRLTDELSGERDLRSRLLRVNHMLSITEDPTRAFRIARLAGRFGFLPSDETAGSLTLALRARAFDLLTGERLFREFSLIALEPDPAAALRACSRLDLLQTLGPGLRWNATVAKSVTRLAEGIRTGILARQETRSVPDRALLLLMLMSLGSRPAQRAALAARLRITGEAAERLRAAPARVSALIRALSGAVRPSRIAHVCEQSPPDALALAWASGPAAVSRAIDLYLGKLSLVRSSLTGETLKEMGFPPGPHYREILLELRRARLDGRVLDDEAERKLAVGLGRRYLKTGRRKD